MRAWLVSRNEDSRPVRQRYLIPLLAAAAIAVGIVAAPPAAADCVDGGGAPPHPVLAG